MWEILGKQLLSRIALLFFVAYSVWWLFFTFSGITPGIQYDLFTVTYGLIAAWGSYWGFRISKDWGGLKSIMGKSIFFFALGLAFQELGQLIYTYYIYFLKIEVPYPSWGDLFFFGSIPFYCIAVVHLAKASGIRISLRSVGGKLQAVFIPVVMVLSSYFIFLKGYAVDFSDPIRVFLDFGYPLGDAVYISLAILTYTLTKGVLGGIMKVRVLLVLIALLFQYIADWTFSYQASRGGR